MKEAIIGYITGMINNHQRIVDSLTRFKYSDSEINRHKNILNELSDLLDFIEDMPEEKSSVINFNINGGEVTEFKNPKIEIEVIGGKING